MAVFLKEFTAYLGGVEYHLPKLRMGDYAAIAETMREREKQSILAHSARNGILQSDLPRYYVAVDSDQIPLGKIRWNAANTVEGAKLVWERIWKRMEKDAAAKLQAEWEELEPEELMNAAVRAVTAEEKPADPPPPPA